MKEIILCEGSTDYVLLQYYMREAHQWIDDTAAQKGVLKFPGQRSRNLTKQQTTLTVAAVGGCSQLGNGLEKVLERNHFSAPNASDIYSKIVIVTDRDEVGTEEDFIGKVKQILGKYQITYEGEQFHNEWIPCTMTTQIGLSISFSLLLLIIPFEESGAMETFLLKAVADADMYDKKLIERCEKFVDAADPERRYLTSRRYVTKAKFDTYFSIRTPAAQFTQRQDIIKNVRWEQYDSIQVAFQKLGNL